MLVRAFFLLRHRCRIPKLREIFLLDAHLKRGYDYPIFQADCVGIQLSRLLGLVL